MGLDGCGKFVKFTMFGANLLILIGGITVLAVGIWTCADKAAMENLVGSNLYSSAAIILIVTGCIVIIISFIGCLGAFRENKCLLLTYFIILFFLFVIMLVGGILGFVFKGNVQEKMRKEMIDSVPRYESNKDKNIVEIWDKVQKDLKCCGIAKDKMQPYQIWKSPYPLSCCKPSFKKTIRSNGFYECQYNPGEQIYLEDCYDKAYDALVGHAVVVGGVGIGIACILILGMVFSMILFKMIE